MNILVEVPTAQVDFDKRHTSFDQPSRQQTALPKAIGAVLLFHFSRLFVHLERFHLIACHQRQRLFQNLGVLARGQILGLVGKLIFDGTQRSHSLHQTAIVNFHVQVANTAVAGHRKGSPRHAQETGASTGAAN